MHEALEKQGWWHTKYEGFMLDNFLLKIAEELGKPVGGRGKSKLVDVLRPISAEAANPMSLSKRYSLAEFPLHCDTAHWTTPSRYIVFGCQNPGNCGRKTILLDWNSVYFNSSEREVLKNEAFLVKNGRNSFYSSIIPQDENYTRFDLGCMFPVDKGSLLALDLLQERIIEARKLEYSWERNDVLVIDNWRLLHGRGSSSQVLNQDSTRELHRVLVI